MLPSRAFDGGLYGHISKFMHLSMTSSRHLYHFPIHEVAVRVNLHKMGSSGSKVSQAAGSATRKYPKSLTGTPLAQPAVAASHAAPQAPPRPAQSQPGPTVRPPPHASGFRDDAVNLDASDPDFAQSLRSLGPVQPNPTLSPTSAFQSQDNGIRRNTPDPRKNPAIMVLSARSRLQDEAEVEFEENGRRGNVERQYLDVYTIRQILQMRDTRKQNAKEIEKVLGLKEGVVERLGGKGVVEMAYDMGRAQQEINMV